MQQISGLCSSAESIPLFGTTWYTGGPAYWLRRALVSLGSLAFVGVIAGIVGAVVAAIIWGSTSRSPDLGPGLTALGIVTVVSIVGFIWIWRWTPDAREREKEAKQADFITAWHGLGWIVAILLILGSRKSHKRFASHERRWTPGTSSQGTTALDLFDQRELADATLLAT